MQMMQMYADAVGPFIWESMRMWRLIEIQKALLRSGNNIARESKGKTNPKRQKQFGDDFKNYYYYGFT